MIKVNTTTEAIESKGGLILAGAIALKAGLGKIKSTFVKQAANVLLCLYGMMLEGRHSFESIDEKRGSLFFQKALGLTQVYAKETVRLYTEKMAANADEVITQLRQSAAQIIRQAPLHGLWIQGKRYIPVDIDTTAMDNSKTKKEGVGWTYRGFEGYHPILAYVGKEGYLLGCELRPGSQHCQKGTVGFIASVLGQLERIQAGGRILFRMDSGNDSFDTLKAATAKETHYCIIKRNKRRENDEQWLQTAKRRGKRVTSRKGKKVWIGTLAVHPQRKTQTLAKVRMAFEVIERKTDAAGNRLLIPEIEVNSWWTNLACEAEQVIGLYRDPAASEQFHAELKHDMDIERLPSGKFAVHQILLAVAMNAYNTLRLLGQKSVEAENGKHVKRKRLGTVMRELICVAGKLVRHGRALLFRIYEKDPKLPVFLRLYAALCCP